MSILDSIIDQKYCMIRIPHLFAVEYAVTTQSESLKIPLEKQIYQGEEVLILAVSDYHLNS